MPGWLKDAVFYEIYPQSYADSNGDGIGDLQGIIGKLDYVKELGCNALWINPCYDSPFRDAGYDVRDYKKVAARYGTNDDLKELFAKAHEKGIHVLLDLVPGHTSEEHHWFKESSKAEKNEYSGRYIWTGHWLEGVPGHPWIAGECERPACYMLNFFKCQPALNYGFLNPVRPWQSSTDSPEARATLEAMKDVMRFWLDAGCDGFRVDMADSLVKDDDEKKSGTCALWREVRSMLDEEYPDAAIISEWSNPELAISSAHFHMDFCLDHASNGYHTLFRDYWDDDGVDKSFFKADGRGDVMRFLDDYLPRYEATKDSGYISLISCNHDTRRPAFSLSERELKVAYACIYTMPGVPFVYYGDEIAMRYLDLPSKEGGYDRTGSRTPMQWDSSENYGFSTAPADKLYLPQDPSADAPTAEKAMKDPASVYHVIKALLALRHSHRALQADGGFEVLYAGKEKLPFVYMRSCEDDRVMIALNPSLNEVSASVKASVSDELLSHGETSVSADGDGSVITMGAQSFAVYIAE